MSTRNVLLICALAGALAACPAEHPGAPRTGATAAPAASSSTAELGERIYSGNCVPCHQQTGTGIPGVYPTLVGSPVVLGNPVELVQWVVKGKRPPSMPTGRFTTQMLQFGWMQPADAAALFTYLRSHFGNSAPPVDAATVAAALAP